MTKKQILRKLNKEFDKAYKEQLKRSNMRDADYYLFMGKASGIGEAIDIITESLKEDK